MAAAQLSQDQAALVRLILPLYYSEEDIVKEEVDRAQVAWDKILNDTAPAYVARKADRSFAEEYPSCATWFFSEFYARLFDVHPAAKPMFRAGLKSQGKFLVQLMTLALTLVLNQEKLNKVMLNLAEKHNERGVKAIEYGIVGEVLFFTLRKVLGDEEFDAEVYKIWTKIMSRLLVIMVPSALAHELKSGINQEQRLALADDSLNRKIEVKKGERSASAAITASSTVAATTKTDP